MSGSGYNVKITGEITNNSSYDANSFPEVYGLFYKGDELVAIASNYVDTIYSGTTRAFEFKVLQNIPDYDSVEIYVDVW